MDDFFICIGNNAVAVVSFVGTPAKIPWLLGRLGRRGWLGTAECLHAPFRQVCSWGRLRWEQLWTEQRDDQVAGWDGYRRGRQPNVRAIPEALRKAALAQCACLGTRAVLTSTGAVASAAGHDELRLYIPHVLHSVAVTVCFSN